MKFAHAFYAFIHLSVQQTVVESLLSVRARAGRTDLFLVRQVSFTPCRAMYAVGILAQQVEKEVLFVELFSPVSTAESIHSFSVH